MTSKNTTVTWVSPALRALMAWIEAQPPEDRRWLTVDPLVAEVWAAANAPARCSRCGGPRARAACTTATRFGGRQRDTRMRANNAAPVPAPGGLEVRG